MFIKWWSISINFIKLLIIILQFVSLQRREWDIWNQWTILEIIIQVFNLVDLLLSLCHNRLVVVCWPVEVLQHLHMVTATFWDWNMRSFQVFLVNYVVYSFSVVSTDIFSFGILIVFFRINWKVLFFQFLLDFLSLRIYYHCLIKTFLELVLIIRFFSSIRSSIHVKAIFKFVF